MNKLSPGFCIPLFGLCALLPAQGGEKPKTQEPVKVTNPAKPEDKGKDAQGKDPAVADPAIQAIDKFIAEKNIDKKADGWKSRLPMPPKLTFDANTDYFWNIDTELGPIKIRYYPDSAPMHVSSGIYLTRLGFYDGLTFHRIIPGFMAQGGDPAGNGSGGPGYKFPGELPNVNKHAKPGILSMANAGPGTDGCQFFITFKPQPGLDAGYTVWGEVVDGMDTVKALEGKGNPNQAENGAMKTPIKINKALITVAPKAKPADKPAEKPAEKPKEGGDKK